MGSGSSVPKKLEEDVIDPDKEGEDEDVDVDAAMEWGDEDYPEFPRKLFKGFLRGEVSRNKMKKVLVHYANLLRQEASGKGDNDTVFLWRQAFPAVQRVVRPSEPIDLARASSILKDSFGTDDSGEILKCAVQDGGEGLVYSVLRTLPEEGLVKLKDGRFFVESLVPYGAEDFSGTWKLKLLEELLPKCKESLLEEMENKDDNGNSIAIVEFVDCQMIFGTAKLLEVAAGRKDFYEALLTDAEVAQIGSLCSRSVERFPLLDLHQEMAIAICKGDASAVKALLDKKADPNFDFVDGDSATVAPLVLALLSEWESRYARNLLPSDVPYEFTPIVKNSQEVLKTLMSAPGVDINAGAYCYGWHGSHVRMTALGMAITGELDTGGSRHCFLQDKSLSMPRHELVKILVSDPRTDLEQTYFEFYEGGGKVGCGALMLLEREVTDINIDYQAAIVLMQAGALMTKEWVGYLENLDEHIAKMKKAVPEKELEEKEEAERRAQRAVEAAQEAEAEAAEAAEQEEEAEEAAEETQPKEEEEEEEEPKDVKYEKREDGSLVWQGITFVDAYKKPRKPESKVLAERLKGLAEVKTWYETVKRGSNVFKTPAAFPPNFCWVAAALSRRFKANLGRRCISCILDFLNFFEFNRRRPLGPLAWHKSVNQFGRPLAPVVMETEKLFRRISDVPIDERKSEGADQEETQKDFFSKGDAESCWSSLYQERGYCGDDEDEGE